MKVSIAAVIACTSALAISQQVPRLGAVKFEQPPTIDGVVDTEKEWTNIPSVSGLVDAASGQAVPDGAQFWIGYDDRFVYFAARVVDAGPISATEYRTNTGLSGDDYIQLDLDPTGSLGEFNTFQVNPRGATNVELAGGRAAKREWSGEIIAKGRTTETGWEVEARIPWQIMKLPGAGKRDLRFNFTRNIARLNRQLTHVYTLGGNTAKTPYWTEVVLPRPVFDRSIKLLPYTYLGYDPQQGGVFNAGLDLKTSLTDQVQLVGSVNPDFRNIENQILSLDFSRFERLAGETRPFFQEGANYSGSQIFVSQRIPGFDVGVNSYGRFDGKTNFGLIDAVDFDTLPSGQTNRGTRNNFVATVTQQPDADTNIRASITSLTRPGLSNQAYLVRGSRDFGPLNLFIRSMGSRDTMLGYGQMFDASLQLQQKDFQYYVVGASAQKDFLPRLGFVQETDYKGLDMGTAFNRVYNKGFWNDWGYSLNHTDYKHMDGTFYRRATQGSVFATLRNGVYGVMGFDEQNFMGSRDHLYQFQTGFPRGNPYKNINLGYDVGRQAGSDYKSARVSGAYRLANRLQLTGSYQRVSYQGIQDQAIVGWNYELDSDRAISGRLVKRQDKLNAYLSFRKSGNRGAEYFLILGDPNALSFRASVILKLVVPFQIGR
ncbi:MAG TPA: DUF5916 domain-containing protein [Fimbriimonas sp.]|nr:DUF5916 domain-containing protein [Fimbriimonas sp.]